MHGTDGYVQSDHRTTACGRHDDIDEQIKPGETRFHRASQSASEPPTACGRACVRDAYIRAVCANDDIRTVDDDDDDNGQRRRRWHLPLQRYKRIIAYFLFR